MRLNEYRKYTVLIVATFIVVIFLETIVKPYLKYHTNFFRKDSKDLLIESLLADERYLKEEIAEFETTENFKSLENVDELRKKSDVDYKQIIISQLPKDDKKNLIDLNSFNFTIFKKVCDVSILVLVVVISAPQNMKMRQSIRETWGETNPDLRLIFIIGATDPQKQNEIEKESMKHNDILQGNFVDSYKNLTYKHVMALKYATYYCPQTRYVLKTDDDVFINVPLMNKYLKEKLEKCDSIEFLLCNTLYNSPVIRDSMMKWGVSLQEYPHEKYPTYCLGYAILYSWDVVFKLYTEAQSTPYFWIDDVYVTGILAEKLELKHRDAINYTISIRDADEIIFNNGLDGKKNYIIGPAQLDFDTMHGLWDAMRVNRMESDFDLPKENC